MSAEPAKQQSGAPSHEPATDSGASTDQSLEYIIHEGDRVEFPGTGNTYKLSIRPKKVRVGIALLREGSVKHSDRIDLAVASDRRRFLEALGIVADSCAEAKELLALSSLIQPMREQIDQEATESVEEEDSQATLLVELAQGAELFHTPNQEAYATVAVNEHQETWHVRSKGFKRWLVRLFYESEERVPSSQALNDALGVLEGQALYDGEEIPVSTRLAEHEGVVYVDLANDDWEVVAVQADGTWKIITNPPIKFRRTRGIMSLPRPVEGGSLEALRQFVNVAGDADWRLLIGWLVTAFNPSGPYFVLVLHGGHGTAKSTVMRLLRLLVDPNSAALRSKPRDERDLAIAATNGWVVAFDNLSALPDWLSDAICRLATGGGFATRLLYTDDEEKLFEWKRPVALNGIEELAARGDLLDRSLILYLPEIAKDKRRSEKAILRDFEAAAPKLLGALLTAVAGALHNLPRVRLETLPRMADAALWMTAAESALGWPKGAFMETYAANQTAANELTLAASLLTEPLQKIVTQAAWQGTATELLAKLDTLVDESTSKRKEWPKTPQGLSNALRRIVSNLREIGVDVAFDRRGGRRLISVGRVADPPRAGSAAAPEHVARPDTNRTEPAPHPENRPANKEPRREVICI